MSDAPTDERARGLIYPLNQIQDRLYWLMVKRCKPGSVEGRLLVQAQDSLSNAQKIARTLYAFDPTGL